jgi:hypothetical protein
MRISTKSKKGHISTDATTLRPQTDLHLTPTSTLALDPDLIPKLNRTLLQLRRGNNLIDNPLLEQFLGDESVAEEGLAEGVAAGARVGEAEVEETGEERGHRGAKVDLTGWKMVR